MRALIQRVRRAAVYVVGDPQPPDPPSPPATGRELSGQIGPGLVVLLAIRRGDAAAEAQALAARVATLRIFDDSAGKLNLSILDAGGEVLSVPQFTLYADTRKGRRPSFVEAAPPHLAEQLYQDFNQSLEAAGVRVVRGKFRAHMIVEIHNDGPVTILLDAPAQ